MKLPFYFAALEYQQTASYVVSIANGLTTYSNTLSTAWGWPPGWVHVEMFSPDASTHAGPPSQRNPRRRQRTQSDDSFGIRPPAKRVRTPIAHDTFEPVSDQQTNGHATESLVANGHAASGRVTRDASSDTTSLAYRVGKKQEREKRGGHGDGSTVLVSFMVFKPLLLFANAIGVPQDQKQQLHCCAASSPTGHHTK